MAKTIVVPRIAEPFFFIWFPIAHVKGVRLLAEPKGHVKLSAFEGALQAADRAGFH